MSIVQKIKDKIQERIVSLNDSNLKSINESISDDKTSKELTELLNFVNSLSYCPVRDSSENKFDFLKCQLWYNNPRGCLNCNESFVKREDLTRF